MRFINGTGRRSPLGLRGLKFVNPTAYGFVKGRSPLGLRGLKYIAGRFSDIFPGRSPLGLRGLKLKGYSIDNWNNKSQPSWAAWIEISFKTIYSIYLSVAALLGCVD